jgi:AraC family transcriptional regulator
MRVRGSSGDRFAHNFRSDEPAAPIVSALRSDAFAAARIVHSQPNHGIVEIPAEETYVFSYLMREFTNNDLWVDRRPADWEPVKPGQIHFYNLEGGIRANIKDPLDFVYIYLKRSALIEFAEEHGLQLATGCNLQSGKMVADPTIGRAARALLPALQHPIQANQLFIDYNAFTLQAHFARQYGGIRRPESFFRGGLAPWQENRVKELIDAHLDGGISIAQLARECRLSRSHFLRAFKSSTGKTPHQWLLQSRVERSKISLLFSESSLSEIAETFGFASQSHFTRVFSTIVGASPSVWRRAFRH